MRLLVAGLLTLLGLACFVVAAANIYNIDRQPWLLLGGYALAGVFALTAAFRLARPSRTPRPDAPAT